MGKVHKVDVYHIIVILMVSFCLFLGVSLTFGYKYVNNNLLESNENTAIDIALLIKNNFTITDEEVSYMKSITFNEMEVDEINKRLMSVGNGVAFNCEVRNLYVLALLNADEIKYRIDENTSEFFGYEEGTYLNGIWLLNGTFDEDGSFVATVRDDIYRYTYLDEKMRECISREESYGELTGDAWGNFVTGYVPIYTVEGNYVGMLGVDIEPDAYQRGALRFSTFVIAVLTASFILMSVLFLWFYKKNISAMAYLAKDKEAKYQKQLIGMSEIDDKNLIAKGRHNLTKNSTDFYTARDQVAILIDEKTTYDEAVEKLSKLPVYEEKQKEIQQTMERANLLREYANGKHEGSIDYQRIMSNNEEAWVQLRYAVFEEPQSKDIILFMYSYNITERKIDQEILSRISSLNYDELGLLNTRTGEFLLKDIKGKAKGRTTVGSGDFEDVAKKRLTRILLPSEREDVISKFKVDNIINNLDKYEKYEIIYSAVDDQKGIRRKKCKFNYLNENKTYILYSISDVTAMYEREKTQFRQVEDALERAKQANEAKTQFFSRMSHDLRTPMNGILGLIELSEDEEDIEVIKEHIEKMKSASNYLLGLINDSLDFQKIESGKITLKPENVNAKKLFENIESMVHETAKAKNVSIIRKFINTDINNYVKVDPMRIKQIFINLLSNAVKFTPNNGIVEVIISCEERRQNISRTKFVIRDSGIGMSEEFLNNGIFRPFSQESNEITSSYAGTGLGLSIAKSLIELMGGTISVESQKNVGTTFTVVMDLERVDESEVVKDEEKDVKRNELSRIQLSGKNILMAEDHPLNAEIMCRLLEKMEAKVTWTKNGKECIDRFLKSDINEFDIILMDIRMPVMDGIAATKAIRKLERMDAANIPIIAVTANAYSEDVQTTYEAGMNAHLPKPIEAELLYETIAKWVK